MYKELRGYVSKEFLTNQEELEKTSSKAEVMKRNLGSRSTLTQRKEAWREEEELPVGRWGRESCSEADKGRNH